jgi:hypothetical protein
MGQLAEGFLGAGLEHEARIARGRGWLSGPWRISGGGGTGMAAGDDDADGRGRARTHKKTVR